MDKQFLEAIASKLDQATEQMVENTVNELLASDEWIAKIEKLASQRILDKVSAKINALDVNLAIKNVVLENKQQIINELASDFATSGMTDTADELQLTVMNDAVVVENELYTNDLTVERNSTLKGDVLVDGDLAIKGRVNVDNASWQELATHIGDNTYQRVKSDFEQGVVDQVVARAKEGINFENVIIGNEHLVADNALASGVVSSNLQQLGTLNSLAVKETLTAKKGRLGINTENPTDALTVWEEEVSLCAGKHSAGTGYIGTAKNQDLVIGTNKQRQIQLSKDGGVWVDSLTIDKNSIGHAKTVPNYSGTKGDIVFNIDHKPGEPFAWICLGNYRWNELRSAE